MSGVLHYRDISELPATIPVFPLSGALLLPRGRLPLNIFEPRYLAMVRDALGAERLIGMIQPADATGRAAAPRLWRTGCVGKITSFSETDDGRFMITLTGLVRFDVAEELATLTPYRRIQADYTPYVGDLAPAADAERVDREALVAALKRYFERHGMSADWKAIEVAPTEPLVNTLAMICPFGAPEKQALLEALTLEERTRIMIALIEMDLAQASPGEDSLQ